MQTPVARALGCFFIVFLLRFCCVFLLRFGLFFGVCMRLLPFVLAAAVLPTGLPALVAVPAWADTGTNDNRDKQDEKNEKAAASQPPNLPIPLTLLDAVRQVQKSMQEHPTHFLSESWRSVDNQHKILTAFLQSKDPWSASYYAAMRRSVRCQRAHDDAAQALKAIYLQQFLFFQTNQRYAGSFAELFEKLDAENLTHTSSQYHLRIANADASDYVVVAEGTDEFVDDVWQINSSGKVSAITDACQNNTTQVIDAMQSHAERAGFDPLVRVWSSVAEEIRTEDKSLSDWLYSEAKSEGKLRLCQYKAGPVVGTTSSNERAHKKCLEKYGKRDAGNGSSQTSNTSNTSNKPESTPENKSEKKSSKSSSSKKSRSKSKSKKSSKSSSSSKSKSSKSSKSSSSSKSKKKKPRSL